MRSEVHQQVVQRHRQEIARMVAEFEATLGQDDAPAPFGARGHVHGRAASVTDRHAFLTIGMSWMDATEWAATTPAAAHLVGTLTTVSLAAHHRLLGSRLPIDLDESDSWAHALTGNSEHLLAAGALSGNTNGAGGQRMLTVYYYLYRDAAHRPSAPPAALRAGLFRDHVDRLRSVDTA